MAAPVIAIGLDSADRELCARWLDQGLMPNLAALKARGASSDLVNVSFGVAEAGWTTFLTGVPPEQSGFWSQLRLADGSYRVDEVGGYPYDAYPPFYALGPDFKVAAVDIPHSGLSDKVNGIQIQAYGAHSAYTPQRSSPPELLAKLTEKHGPHPAFDRDKARLWRGGSMTKLTDWLTTGAKRRGAICADLIGEQDWDLFLVIFSEFHSGGHYLLHLTREDHPLNQPFGKSMGGREPMAEVAQAVDKAIGEMIAAAPEDATYVVFSQEGMVPNNLDGPSTIFLPELLYRWSMPGQQALQGGPPGDNRPPARPITHPWSFGWARKVYSLKHDRNKLRAWLRRRLPVEVGNLMEKLLGAPEGFGYLKNYHPWFQPAMWYSDHWPKMKAFALPSYSDGYVRLNLEGREPNGIVARADYDKTCDEIEDLLNGLRDARTGEPIVARITRMRSGPDDTDPLRPDADIVVNWRPFPADIVDSPTCGRMGPIPFSRSGGHVPQGFMIAAGPGIDADSFEPSGHVLDLTPTILDLMGAPAPDYMPGHSLRRTPETPRAVA